MFSKILFFLSHISHNFLCSMNKFHFLKFLTLIFLSFGGRLKKRILLFAGLALIFSSCHKDSVITIDNGYAYFPDKAGHYVIYDVDSIIHNDFTKTVDTFKYQLKEYIESVFYDNSGRPTLRIERYKRTFKNAIRDTTASWILNNVLAANRTVSTAERIEDNQRFIKLIFPVNQKRTWNGNAYNTMNEWTYQYTSVDAPLTLGSLTFDSTLTVKQIDFENLVNKKYYIEKYAKNIGLVYKEVVDVSSDSIIPFVPLMKRITKGVEYRMTVNSFGSN